MAPNAMAARWLYVKRQESVPNTGHHWDIYVEYHQVLKEPVTPHRHRSPAVPTSPGCTLKKRLQPPATLCAQKGTGQIFWRSRKCTSQGGAPLYFLPAQPKLALRMWQVPASDSDINHVRTSLPSKAPQSPRLEAMHDPTGFQELLGRASLGQQRPHHTFRARIPSGSDYLKHPGKAMSTSYFQPSGPLLHIGPWLTGPIGPLSPLTRSLPEPQRLGTI